MTGDRRGGLRGVGGRLMAMGVATVPPGERPARPMPRSISAPTIAGSWWRARPATGFRVIDAFSRIIRLGEGISASGRISEPRSRARSRRWRSAATRCEPRRHPRAADRHRSLPRGREWRRIPGRVADEVGLELEIVDRETEAELAATGCTPLIDPDAEGVILFDIGGGSSELVRLGRSAPCRRGPPLPEIKAWVSLPVGVVTLAERHGGHDVTREIYEAMVQEVAGHLAPFVAAQRLPGGRPHASARHLRHGHDHRRRASRSEALRPPPRRRLLDDRRCRRPSVVERLIA